MIAILPLSLERRPDILSVARRMRPRDQHEARCFGLDPETHAVRMADACGPGTRVVYLDTEPVFVFGALPFIPGVVQLFGYGTTRTRKVIPFVTNYILSEFGPSHFQTGTRRIQVMLPLQSTDSVNWLLGLGMRVETVMREFGVHGEPILLLAYTHMDWLVDHVLHESPGSVTPFRDRGSGEDRFGNSARG